MLRNLILPDRWWSLVVVAFTGKLLLLLLVLWEHHAPLTGDFYAFWGHSTGYTEPVESLLSGAGYPQASRMPGYAVPYLFLRLIMNVHGALRSLVVLQVLASALGVVLLAKLAYAFTHDLRAFRWTYWLALLAVFTSFYDRYILTESFSSSALILATWAIVRHGKHAGRWVLFLAGTATAWLIFMKPVFLPVLLVVAAFMVVQDKFQWRRILPKMMLFFTPFLLADGVWSLRNAVSFGVFQPLTDGVFSSALREGVKYPVIRLVQAYGGNILWWDPSAEILWFNVREADQPAEQPLDGPFPFPEHVLTEDCPMDTLERVAFLVNAYNSTDGVARKRALAAVSAACDRCVTSFRRDRPFHYHITARLRMLRLFVLTPGNSALMAKPFAELNALEKALKLLYALICAGTIIPGIIWGLRSFFHARSSVDLRLVSALMLYGVFIFPLAMRMTETRYLTTVYPFAVLFTVLMGIKAWDSTHQRSSA